MGLSEFDRNLLDRCLARLPKAWEDFVDRFMGLVVHVTNHTATARSMRLTSEDREDLCAEVGEEPATVALAWLLSRPEVTAPIIGPRLADHFTGALRAVDLTLDEKVLARLDELFPGYKTSPEAYAW